RDAELGRNALKRLHGHHDIRITRHPQECDDTESRNDLLEELQALAVCLGRSLECHASHVAARMRETGDKPDPHGIANGEEDRGQQVLIFLAVTAPSVPPTMRRSTAGTIARRT